MSSAMTLPVCRCCHRNIMPNDKCVRFPCPECGEVTIWRCQSCRESAKEYVCDCGFRGP